MKQCMQHSADHSKAYHLTQHETHSMKQSHAQTLWKKTDTPVSQPKAVWSGASESGRWGPGSHLHDDGAADRSRGVRGGLEGRKGVVEGVHEVVGVGTREAHGGLDAEDVAVDSTLADEDAVLILELLHRLRQLRTCWLLHPRRRSRTTLSLANNTIARDGNAKASCADLVPSGP